MNQLLAEPLIHFAPEQAHESIQGVLLDIVFEAPNGFHNRGAGYHPAHAPHQKLQEAALGRREADFLAPSDSLVRGGIER
jgi:hypothetical protein